MKKYKLNDMIRGWFVGDFEPTLYRTRDVEVGVKHFTQGEREAWHYHKVATEISVVIEGQIEMGGQRYEKGEIVVVPPGEGVDFHAVTDAVLAVVKLPGAVNDKYT